MVQNYRLKTTLLWLNKLVLFSGEKSVTVSACGIVIDDIETLSHNILLVSTDENGVTVSADIMDSSSTESDDEEFIKERATSKNGGKNRDSRGNRKCSEKFGTLEDFDRSSQGNAETEDDYHGDLNYEAWLTADEVRMCVCACDDYEWLLLHRT